MSSHEVSPRKTTALKIRKVIEHWFRRGEKIESWIPSDILSMIIAYVIVKGGVVYVMGSNSCGLSGMTAEDGKSSQVRADQVQSLSKPSWINAKDDRRDPITVSYVSNVGIYFAVYLTSDGTLYSMGENERDGRRGLGNIEELLKVETGKQLEAPHLIQYFTKKGIRISHLNRGVYYKHICAIDANEPSIVYSWGNNEVKQLGRVSGPHKATDDTDNDNDKKESKSDTFPTHSPAIIPFFKENGIRIVSSSCGSRFSSFLSEDGNVYTCGSNGRGQLGYSESYGNEHQANMARPHPLEIPYFPTHKIRVTLISAGGEHIAFLDDQQRAYITGSNGYGQLGNESQSTTGESYEPLLVQYLHKRNIRISHLQSGGYHIAAITTDKELYMWGRGIEGQVANGSTNNVTTPHLVSFGDTTKAEIVDVKCGNLHVIARTSDNTFYAWGDNSYCQALFKPGTVNGYITRPRVVDFETQFGISKHDIVDFFPGYDHSVIICEQ